MLDKKEKRRVIKMIDPRETSKEAEYSLIKEVLEGDIEAMMIFNDLGLRHIVDITQKYSPKNPNETVRLIRRGLSGFYKALQQYLSHKQNEKHKFTTYSNYYILKEIESD
jgi:DNA-directed RNA polymerase specialized sigma subunit